MRSLSPTLYKYPIIRRRSVLRASLRLRQSCIVYRPLKIYTFSQTARLSPQTTTTMRETPAAGGNSHYSPESPPPSPPPPYPPSADIPPDNSTPPEGNDFWTWRDILHWPRPHREVSIADYNRRLAYLSGHWPTDGSVPDAAKLAEAGFYFDGELPTTTYCFFSFTAYVMSETYIFFLPFSLGKYNELLSLRWNVNAEDRRLLERTCCLLRTLHVCSLLQGGRFHRKLREGIHEAVPRT
jgi:hypothetical protein